MNKTLRNLTVFALGMATAAPLIAAEAPAATATPAADSKMVTTLGLTVQKSEFTDHHAVGHDPFFPTSTRREPKARAVVASPTNQAPQDPRRIEQISLKGITGSADRRLALINNMAFAEGEIGNVRIAGGQVKIRVLKIADKSVTLAIEGESSAHELKIRQSLHDFTKVH